MTTITESTNQFIRLSSFQKLGFWDYYTLSNKASIFSNFPLIELGTVIKQRKESIVIDDTKSYKRCRVQLYGNGVVLRDEVLGKEIKTKKQQPCKTNDFLVAEIDAKFGGYGIVPSELEGAIVSSHYFLFEINQKKLLPEFLSLVVKCNDFSKQVKATGSTNYAAIRPYHVLDYLIPLPTLEEQNQIVEAYNKRITEAERLETEAKQLEERIEEYLFDVLELKHATIRIDKGRFQITNFSILDRWAVDYLNKIISSSKILTGKYPVVALAKLIDSFQYGLSEKSTKERSGIPMLRMNNIQNSELNVKDLKYITIDEKTKEKYILDKGDLLFNRTNSKELVGKTAVFKEDGEFTFASYLIRVKLNSQLSNVDFINLLFNSSILQYQKDMVSRKILGQANINSKEMQDFLFPVPPLDIQKEIVKKVREINDNIYLFSQKAESNRHQAITEFESKIFMPCN